MAANIDQVLFHSSYNSFKNNGVSRTTLSLPDSYPAMTDQVVSYTFTLQNDTDFVQLLVYATDYAKPFLEGFPIAYANKWVQVEQALDYLLKSDSGLIYYFNVDYKVVGNQVTVSARIPKFSSAFNVSPHVDVPIAFVEYTLAR